MNFKQGKSHPCNVEPPRCMVPNMCNYISITTINSEEVFNIKGMGLSNPEPFIIEDHHWKPVSFNAQVPNQSSVNDFHISSGTWKDTKSCRVMIYWHIFHTKLDDKKIGHDTMQSMKPGNRRQRQLQWVGRRGCCFWRFGLPGANFTLLLVWGSCLEILGRKDCKQCSMHLILVFKRKRDIISR